MMPLSSRLLLLIPISLLSSCATLASLGLTDASHAPTGIEAPRVSVAEVRLTDAPTDQALASFYCQRHVPALASQLVCRAFGPLRTERDLRFAFDVELEVQNPNTVPLPVVQALVAFTAYPNENSQELGAVCASFCEDPSSCAQDAAGACESDAPQIRDLSSFAGASVGFLRRVATGESSLEDLRIRTVAPGETTRVVVRLELDSNQVLGLIERAGEDAIDQVRQGQQPRFAIPYRIEGSAWVEVEGFGRFAAGFGPYERTWWFNQ